MWLYRNTGELWLRAQISSLDVGVLHFVFTTLKMDVLLFCRNIYILTESKFVKPLLYLLLTFVTSKEILTVHINQSFWFSMINSSCKSPFTDFQKLRKPIPHHADHVLIHMFIYSWNVVGLHRPLPVLWNVCQILLLLAIWGPLFCFKSISKKWEKKVIRSKRKLMTSPQFIKSSLTLSFVLVNQS